MGGEPDEIDEVYGHRRIAKATPPPVSPHGLIMGLKVFPAPPPY
jgi:hypothetical protein